MSNQHKTNCGGFTLIELIVTVTIAGILAAVAVPSFRNFIASQRIKTASFELVADLTQTRSEAIKRNTSVAICKTSASGWQGGWSIGLGTSCPLTTTLKNHSAYSNISITDSATVNPLIFRGDGRLSSTSTNFTIDASPSISGVTARCIKLSLSGQPSSISGSCS